MPVPDRPMIVVSNRLPVTVQRGPRGLESRPSTGGLVRGLEPVLDRYGGTWIGWPGIKLRPGETLSSPGDPYEIIPIELSDSEVGRYYHNLSNRALWPLFHSFPERTRFDRNDWQTYDEVNERFARAACEADGELIWVHDYQLLRTPHFLRRERPDARIAFFLHIPFPPYDVYRILPWYREILHGLLACDLIGFHVEGYARNFLDCAERLLRVRVDRNAGLVEHGEHTARVGVFPLGIDFERFEERARAAPAPPERADGERVVLGVDRLDYTKGIPERIKAFERLLELHPEHRERVVLLQLAVPSRDLVAEYQDLKREVDELVGRVNGRFATATWSPIRYLYRSVSPERLAGLYRDADVALVTPLRDGMNLVAKEFVACQVDDPGVLVLSRLAGAAETMHEAILVNPYNVDSMAAAIDRGLTMDESQRRLRLVRLRLRERRNNVGSWVDQFLAAAAQAGLQMLQPTAPTDFEAWLGPFVGGHRLALFLDYDGTLSPIAEHPSDAKVSEEMLAALRACAFRDDTDVTVVSGRGLEDIKAMLGVAGLTYAANHGMEIERPDAVPFRHQDLVHYQQRTHELAASLREIGDGGAWTEEKGATLTFHFRGADPARHASLADEARRRIQAAGYQARDAHCAVEARPPIGWDKGHAVLHILRHRYGPAWSANVRAIYVGDDLTDEDAFRVLSGLGITFRVGDHDTPTEATRELANVDAVCTLLQWLARRPVLAG